MMPVSIPIRFTVRAALFALMFAETAPFTGAYQQKATAKSQEMTVEKVIKMVQASVAEDLIIAQLRKANKPIEVSAEDMINLKQNHVSDNIVKVMMDPSVPIEPPPPPPMRQETTGVKTPDSGDDRKADPNDPKSPHDPGIYLYAKDAEGSGHMTILDKASVEYPDCVAGRVLTEPSQFDRTDAGRHFVFNKGTAKVSTTFSVREEERTSWQWRCAEAVAAAGRG